MKTTGEIKDLLQKKELDSTLLDIYLDESRLDYQRQRYIDALTRYEELYGAGEIAIFSAPGRSEIGGNHTDHQHGEVLAASINLDAIAITAPVDEPVVRVVSDGYDMITVSLDDLAVKDELKGYHRFSDPRRTGGHSEAWRQNRRFPGLYYQRRADWRRSLLFRCF